MNCEEVMFLISGGEIRPMITMPVSGTIYQLKKKIAEKIRVPVGRQNLFYGNMKLRDFIKIKEYNFGVFTELDLAVDMCPGETTVDVTVSSPAFSVELRINKIQKVIQVKEKLAELFAIGTEDITLWHMSKKMVDEKPLHKYYVTQGSDIRFTRTGFYS